MNRTQRRTFSESRLEELRRRLADGPASGIDDLMIYATGSLGRLEASENSDLDLFFMFDGSPKPGVARLRKVLIDANLIGTAADLKYPEFSGDGKFLDVHYFDSIAQVLGSDQDDSTNAFTARMLLLLESRPIFNGPRYDILLRKTVDLYFRDFPEHSSDFRPLFLVNDICRFWRTLCLNYEHARRFDKPDEKAKAAIKNLKLKFSRLITCFGTILALSQKRTSITANDVVALSSETPLERMRGAAGGSPKAQALLSEIDHSYDWFLTTTDRPKPDLIAWIQQGTNRKDAFDRAAAFGDRVYKLLNVVADTSTIRNLVL